MKMPGLKAAARVTRDVNGIAHVSARNEHDLFFLQGYVHAQDRLFQMDLTRRRVSGTLAELLGPSVLSSDVQLRTIGLRRAAQRSRAVLSPRALAAVEAYAEGVNAWVAANPLPPEYGALEITRFVPWTALDGIVVAKGVTFELSFDLGDIDRTRALQTYATVFGQQTGTLLFFEDLFRSAPFDPASTVPDASTAPATPSRGSVRARAGSPDPDAAELGRKYLEKLDQAPELRRLLDREVPNGSNEWAVSGALTVEGKPLLANDPHLALGTPSTFYPIHLEAGPLDVIGSSFPGTPFVVVGHNRRITWGATINPMDVTDVYQEQVVQDPSSPSGLSTVYLGQPEPIVPIPEVFRANQVGNGVADDVVVVPPGGGIPPATLIVPRRNQGPILQFDPSTGKALSLQYTGFSATRELDAILLWNVARGLDDFQAALAYFDCGSINLAYADVEGNIAYFTSAEMPVREDLQAGGVAGLPPYFIRSGQGGNEWLPVQHPQPGQALPYEILPAEEMPHVVNPAAGWFVNANNDPAGTTLDNNPLNQLRPGGGIYYLNPSYDGYRAGRITRMLRERVEGGQRLSVDDLKAMQADVELPTAPVFVPHVLQALKNAQQPGALAALMTLAAYPGVQEAVERLSAWDFTAPTGIPEGYDASDEPGNLAAPSEDEIEASVAATLFAVWQGQFLKNTVDAPTASLPSYARPASQQAVTALRNLLDNFDDNGGVGASGIDFFQVPGVASADDRRDILILQSLKEALALLSGGAFAPAFGGSKDQDDYRWGKLHRIVFEHPLGGPFNVPPGAGLVPAPLDPLPGLPTDGGFGTVDASHHDVRAASANGFMFKRGPVTRFAAVADNRGGVRAEASYPGGTSGVPGDPHAYDLLALWLTNDTLPLRADQDDLQKAAESVTKLVPSPR